jgi:putative restriction endonuclease
MRLFVGVTDNKWFDFLSNLQDIDEVNFWRPSPDSCFKSLQPGEIFLFKLHSPKDFIAGGGVFAYSTILPISLAWDAFREKNGASSYEEMRRLIVKRRGGQDNCREDFKIGCILLTQPFFFAEAEWIKPPNWRSPIVRGKAYELNTEAGKFLWDQVQERLTTKLGLLIGQRRTEEEHVRYGKEILIKPRLGQGAFKVLVTDAYQRSCTITQERALPVLEAAHIRPFSQDGPHQVSNGILLRSDMHRLFDKGYMTITPKLNIEVSQRIKDEFENGKYYFTFHGHQINPPRRPIDRPSPGFLTWHNENIFRA